MPHAAQRRSAESFKSSFVSGAGEWGAGVLLGAAEARGGSIFEMILVVFIVCQATRPRIFFVSARRRLDSTSFAFVPRERVAFLRRSRAASARRAFFFASAASLIFRRSLRRAVSRFIACDRESDTVTMSPVGLCRSVTAVETLFTCCPPGPLERENISSKSDSGSFFMRNGHRNSYPRNNFFDRTEIQNHPIIVKMAVFSLRTRSVKIAVPCRSEHY